MEALPALAYGEKHRIEPDEEVHQWLTREAWRYFESQIAGAELDSFIGVWGVDGLYADRGQSTVLDGARDEDKGQKPPLWQGVENVFFDLDSPSMRHFCASAKDFHTGYFFIQQYDANIIQAQRIWKDNEADNLMLRYAEPDKTAAYYRFGHVAHLIQDLTIPAHTHNDPHGSNIPGLHDSYEQDWTAAHFRDYRYDNAVNLQYVLRDRPIAVPATLLEVFQQTAEYTDDYDSEDVNGEYAESGTDACYFPADYPAAALHRPADALREDDGSDSVMPDGKCAIIADDLMYWAMRQTAQLFRFFYKEVDSGAFHAEVRLVGSNIPLASDEAFPVSHLGPKRALLHVSYSSRTDTDFPASGIVRNSCTFHYDFKPDGGGWSGEIAVPFPAGAGDVPLDTQAGTYRVWVSAENGGGTVADPVYGYFRAPGFTLVLPPKSAVIECSKSLFLNVVVSGAGDGVSYEWHKDGQPIPGANADTYAVSSVGYQDTGRYTCIVTDPEQGTIVTPAAMVEVVEKVPVARTTALCLAVGTLLALGAWFIARDIRSRPLRAKG